MVDIVRTEKCHPRGTCKHKMLFGKKIKRIRAIIRDSNFLRVLALILKRFKVYRLAYKIRVSRMACESCPQVRSLIALFISTIFGHLSPPTTRMQQP